MSPDQAAATKEKLTKKPPRKSTAPVKPPAPRQDGTTIRRETVTPEIAYRWLERNTNNRAIHQATIDQYARDMKTGRWHMTGDPIRFGASGRLLDGQQRLWACIIADVPFETMVVRGIVNEEEVMDVIDTGRKRTLAHALQIHGEKETRVLAAVSAMCWRWENDRFRSGTYPTHEEALYWIDQHPDVRQAVTVARQAYQRGLKMPVTVIGAAYYLNARVDAEAAELFWQKASTGENLAGGDPILAFRRWAFTSLQKREKPSSRTWFVYSMKAMQQWRDGRKVRQLSVHDGEQPGPWTS